MKTHIKKQFSLALLLIGLGLTLAGSMTAQTFTALYSFTPNSGSSSRINPTNNDGAYPRANLILSGNSLYGTTASGGSSGNGTVFNVNTDGTGFTVLHTFTALQTNSIEVKTNFDGASPVAGLILSGNTLYGTALSGGSSGFGTVFKVNTDGTNFTVLHHFTFFDGSGLSGGNPRAGLILSDDTLYGTTSVGTVFKITTNGTGYTTLYRFTSGSDGGYPAGSLVLSSNTLYGTTAYGGNSGGPGIPGSGTVFKINSDGASFTTLYRFTATSSFPYTNSDGANPQGSLILSGNTLYGTAAGGGSSSYGTVFAVNTDGTGFTNLHTFTSPVLNNDGRVPTANLILSGNTLFGTASQGGIMGSGTVFAINTDGTGFTPFSFPFVNGGFPEGHGPQAGLILSGNTLYGTTAAGGIWNFGTVFSLLLPALQLRPTMGIVMVANQIVLLWPTNAGNFTLQSTTNLSSASWSNVTSGIAVVGMNNMYTNTLNGKSAFFRLKL